MRISPYLFAGVIVLTIGITWWIISNIYKTKELKTLLTIERLDSSLNDAAKIIQRSTNTVEYEFQERMRYQFRSDIVEIYYPVFNAGIQNASTLSTQIEILKQKIKNQSREVQNDEGTISEMITKGIEIRNLRNSLQSYVTKIFQLMPEEKRANVPILPIQDLIQQHLTDNEWISNYFEGLSAVALIALLSKFQNDLLLSANIICEYCNYIVTPGCNLTCEFYHLLVNQNTTHLMPGQKLKIKVGVGAITCYAKPIITIENKNCLVDDLGLASYQVVAKVKGENSVPIVVRYKDPNTGKEVIRETTVNYIVD